MITFGHPEVAFGECPGEYQCTVRSSLSHWDCYWSALNDSRTDSYSAAPVAHPTIKIANAWLVVDVSMRRHRTLVCTQIELIVCRERRMRVRQTSRGLSACFTANGSISLISLPPSRTAYSRLNRLTGNSSQTLVAPLKRLPSGTAYSLGQLSGGPTPDDDRQATTGQRTRERR